MNAARLGYGLAWGLFLCLTSIELWGEGMFMDGAIYACLSRNMAEGQGGCWSPYFSVAEPVFRGHLPLAFCLQSLFFRLLGDTPYTEAFYTLVLMGASAALLHGLARRSLGEELRQAAFVPWLLMACTPLFLWSVSNNLLENTVLFFDICALYALVRALGGGGTKAFLWATGAGLATLAALLSKGPVGLYVLAAPVVLGGWRAWRLALGMLGGLLVPLALLYAGSDQARQALEGYVRVQLLGSWLGGTGTVPARWFIIVRSLQELLPILLWAALGLGYAWRRRVRPSKDALPWCLLGLCGVLPIMVSTKQSGFYMLPALPCFAMAAALLCAPVVLDLVQGFAKTARFLAFLLLATGLGLSLYAAGRYSRDADKIQAVKALIPQIPKNSLLLLPPDQPHLHYDWALHAYLQRYGHWGLTLDTANEAAIEIRPNW